MSSESVLITDGDDRIALTILRSLAKRKIETCVGEAHMKALSFFSKYCRRNFYYPSPGEDLYGFINTIKRIVKMRSFGVLFPVGDWTLFPISRHRAQITPYVQLPLPDLQTLETTFDKYSTLKIALAEGVPIPKTFSARNVRELKEAARAVTYPAVIKPRCSWIWRNSKGYFGRPRYVNSRSELPSIYKIVHSKFPFPLIQEYIPGNNYSIAALYNKSKLRAICGIKVYRTLPVEGGNSVLRESVEIDAKMKKYATQLLESMNWHGIAEVEFKLDPRNSTPKLMEINGRFWGSLEVAVKAGVDFPYLLYKMAIDGDAPPVFNYKAGVKSRWLGGDIKNLLTVLKNTSKNTRSKYPAKLDALRDFIKIYEKNMTYDSFSLDDILPFFSPIYTGILDKMKQGIKTVLAPTHKA